MEYVCAGYEFQSEKDSVIKDKDKIMADINKRTKVGREAHDSLNFWKESKLQAEEFQNNLQNIQSRLKTIKIGVILITNPAGTIPSKTLGISRTKQSSI